MKLDFSNKTQKQQDALIGDGYFYLQEGAKLGKCVEIVEAKPSKPNKTHEQLRAIYKLFQFSLPHFQKWKPAESWTLDKIKEFVKAELGYTRQPSNFEIAMMIKQSGFKPKDEEEKKKMIKFCKKMKQNISFADFTKEQLYAFTKEYEVWAQTAQGDKDAWSDVFLEPGELTKYFKE